MGFPHRPGHVHPDLRTLLWLLNEGGGMAIAEFLRTRPALMSALLRYRERQQMLKRQKCVVAKRKG